MDVRDLDPSSDYRSMLWFVAGVRSARELDSAGRRRVLDHLEAHGFKPQRPVAPRSGHLASEYQIALIRHIWTRLAAAGAVEHAEESALHSWMGHQTRSLTRDESGYRDPGLLPRNAAIHLIEQLKKWAEREGVHWN
jgi:hypothetical protein